MNYLKACDLKHTAIAECIIILVNFFLKTLGLHSAIVLKYSEKHSFFVLDLF